MSDLSWLNPTPHTIAVYASRPLSPATTQHSLPSGRYPLLGPDFHRLDRTSLRLAHSLDHVVGADDHRRWHGDAERLGPTSAALTVQFRPTCAFFVLAPGRPLSPARTPWVRREGGVAHGRGDRRWPR